MSCFFEHNQTFEMKKRFKDIFYDFGVVKSPLWVGSVHPSSSCSSSKFPIPKPQISQKFSFTKPQTKSK